MTTLTRFPFTLRDTGTEGDCKSSVAANQKDFAAMVRCLVSDDLLKEDLAANPEPLTTVLTKKTLPKWGKPWLKEIQKGMTPVSVYIPGNGSTFEFVFLTVDGQIQGLWKNVSFESN